MRSRWLPAACVVAAILASAAQASGVAWQEDFESATCGAMPDGWISGGGNDEMGAVWDVGSVVCGGNRSLGLFGVLGGCWAALAVHPVALADTGYVANFVLELSVRGGNEPTSGCHGGSRAYAALSTGTNWSLPERALFVMGEDGMLHAPDATAVGSIPLQECGVVTISYARTAPDQVQLDYMVNGNPTGTVTIPADAEEDDYAWLHLVSLEGSSWFDDITMTHGTVAVTSTTWGRIKAGYR